MKHKNYLLPLLGITLLWSNNALTMKKQSQQEAAEVFSIFSTEQQKKEAEDAKMQEKIETEWAKKQPIEKVDKKLSSSYRPFTKIYNHILLAKKSSKKYKENLTKYTAKILRRRLSLKKSLEKIDDKKKTKNITRWVRLIKGVIKIADEWHILLTSSDPDFTTRTVSHDKTKEYKIWSDALWDHTREQEVITKTFENHAVFGKSSAILQKIFHLMNKENGMSTGVQYTVGYHIYKNSVKNKFLIESLNKERGRGKKYTVDHSMFKNNQKNRLKLKKLGRTQGWTAFELKNN